MMRRVVLSTLVVGLLVLAGACSDEDDAGAPTTTTSEPGSTTTTTSDDPSSTTSTTQPTATDVQAVTPVLQELMSRYDDAVTAILADPRVAANRSSTEVAAYLALFTEDSAFADGALASWAREGEQGRFYRPGAGGQLTTSTVGEVTPASADEASFAVCARNSMEVTDAAGNIVESIGGQSAATVVAVRLDGAWRIRDLTERATSDCPAPEPEQ